MYIGTLKKISLTIPFFYKPTSKLNYKHTNKHSGKGGFNNLKSKMRELRKQLRKNAQESLEITKPLPHEYHNTRKHFLKGGSSES